MRLLAGPKCASRLLDGSTTSAVTSPPQPARQTLAVAAAEVARRAATLHGLTHAARILPSSHLGRPGGACAPMGHLMAIAGAAARISLAAIEAELRPPGSAFMAETGPKQR